MLRILPNKLIILLIRWTLYLEIINFVNLSGFLPKFFFLYLNRKFSLLCQFWIQDELRTSCVKKHELKNIKQTKPLILHLKLIYKYNDILQYGFFLCFLLPIITGFTPSAEYNRKPYIW